MKRWAAMLRGINLGKRQIAKAELIAAAESCGYANARTLLASGNLVFDAEGPPAEIERDLHAAVEKRTGIKSEVFVRDLAAMRKLAEANPFPEAAKARPSQLLALFHKEKVPQAALDEIAERYEGPERLAAVGHELLIDYPEGMGRSKLEPVIARLKHKLPVGTGRNWNTVTRLAALLEA